MRVLQFMIWSGYHQQIATHKIHVLSAFAKIQFINPARSSLILFLQNCHLSNPNVLIPGQTDLPLKVWWVYSRPLSVQRLDSSTPLSLKKLE